MVLILSEWADEYRENREFLLILTVLVRKTWGMEGIDALASVPSY